ncbi:glutamate receptor 4 [Elysia marginata]|uniref:Glutamate receptor 4 n=1 Tax=Elysia marginata TaxID=1093978 RepID=A0AAV4I124_9GAST|nr:glutamate receptor 4 [Elysia marginata]
MLIVCVLGHIHLTPKPQQELQEFSALRKALFRNGSESDTFLSRNETRQWNLLLSRTVQVVRYMVCQRGARHGPHNSAFESPKSLVFIYTNELAKVMVELEQTLSCPRTFTKAISWGLDAFCEQQEVQKILMTSLDMESGIKSVVVASSYAHFIQMVLIIMTTNVDFKWRRFLHATEWLVLTIDRPFEDLTDFNYNSLPDFVTVISSQKLYIDISQKSRTQPMKSVLQIPLNLDSSLNQRDSSLSFNVSNQRLLWMSQSFLSRNMRADAVTYLSLQKSIMAGMHIPTVVVVSKPDRTAFIVKEGNRTFWVGYNIGILNILSENLGFTAELFQVTDGGFYGAFKDNGDILGVTGYLARREAGFSPMSLVTSARRHDCMDFVYPSIKNDPFYIMYRAHFGKSQLGDPRSELIDTKQDVIYVLIGPCIVIVVGLFVFLMSGAFLTKDKICGRENLSRLYDFPLEWLFQTSGFYPYHSNRILRASWGLFCVAIFAAYGALLTCNATTPPEFPKINSLEDLLRHPNFKIGVSPYNSHFLTRMKEAREGTTLANLWQVLCDQNKSDPFTFSDDKAHHIRRVLIGEYAFLGSIPRGLLPTFVDADYIGVRFVNLYKKLSRMTIPKHAFYKSDMERILTTANEMGIIDAISDQWYPPRAFLKKSKVKYDMKVHLYRLQFLLYIAIVGVVSAILSLAAEYVMHLYRIIYKRVD